MVNSEIEETMDDTLQWLRTEFGIVSREELRDALDRSRDWMGIGSAKKDSLGPNILLYSKDWYGPMVGFWRSDVQRWGWYGAQGIKNEKLFQPTHWQKLPDLPALDSHKMDGPK